MVCRTNKWGDSVSEQVLKRAVVISLFTWRRAEPSDPVDDDELYGYWGDAFPSKVGDKIGSRLWLLRRRTLTADTLRDAKRYADEALKWLVDDGYVDSAEVTVLRKGSERIDLRVNLRSESGLLEFDFDDVFGSFINAV